MIKLVPAGLLKEAQLLQLPLGATCQICQSALSAPIAKASRRPSSFTCTLKRGLIPSFVGLPKEAQLPQVPPVVVCQICHRSWAASTPTVQPKASKRPSSFFPMAGLALILPGVPNEVQLLVAIVISFFQKRVSLTLRRGKVMPFLHSSIQILQHMSQVCIPLRFQLLIEKGIQCSITILPRR